MVLAVLAIAGASVGVYELYAHYKTAKKVVAVQAEVTAAEKSPTFVTASADVKSFVARVKALL